jgi:hypothetical protein
LQDFDNACLTEEARAQNDLACPIKEARALIVEGINFENTIIVDILKGSLVKGKSYTIYTNFTNCKKVIDRIKAKKADGAESKD